MTTIERQRSKTTITDVNHAYDCGLYDWMDNFTNKLGKECAKGVLQDYWDYHNEGGIIVAGYTYNAYTKEVWDYLADDITR